MICIHCGTAPVLRTDTATGRMMMMCPECKARGDVAIHEARARMSWEIVNDETLPRHGCRNGVYPRFIQVGGKWGYGCKACGFAETGFGSLEGAVSGWVREARHAKA